MQDPTLHGPPHHGSAAARPAALPDRHLPVATRIELRIIELATDLAGPLAVWAQLGGCRR